VDRSGPVARVYSVISPGVIHITPVTLGLEGDQRVEVRSGLQEGDVVVVGRLAGLKDGQPVQAKSQEAEVH
jgi:multidrug efflux pump subunit AcrA (membrane-fusion protein)